MLKNEIREILRASRNAGWVLEPEAKRLLALAGLEVPRFLWAKSPEEAVRFAGKTGYPVVAKVVSPKVIHKSDVGGVIRGIASAEMLADIFQRLSRLDGFRGILVEEMISGLELMVGAKRDEQFGPVVLFGMGGTEVEIYGDTTLRMAPLKERDVDSMVWALKARPLLEGYRGAEPINLEALKRMLMAFSDLIMDLEDMFESVDLNPVMCSSERCVVADARIMLNESLR
jgi:succinyl-CoA synthetase beta subunit